MGGVVKRDHTCPLSSGGSKTGEVLIVLTILVLTENGLIPRDAQRGVAATRPLSIRD